MPPQRFMYINLSGFRKSEVAGGTITATAQISLGSAGAILGGRAGVWMFDEPP